ncbi:MAG: magnesium transporter CorA family protein [Candidatus Saccharibacteria bacterium]
MQQTNNFRAQTHHDTTWIDLENPDQETLADLEKTYGLHPVHVKESTQKIQHVQVEREDGYLFLVLHVPVQTGHDDKIHVTQVGVFLGDKYMVTIRGGASPCITDMFEACKLSSEKAEEYFKEGASYLLFRLVRKLLTDISDMMDDLNNELDEIEDLVFDDRDSDRRRIGRVRQKIVRLSRIIGPKRMLLQDLAEQIDSFTHEDMSKYYSNNTKLVYKLWEEVEEAQETVEIYKDADFTANTEHTNRILAILTLIFTFTIPVTVAGTLYGMNVFLPGGLEAGSWTLFGRYTTFIVLVSLSAAIALGMYMYFRRKRWI